MNGEQPPINTPPAATNPTGLLLVIGLAVWAILAYTFLHNLGQAVAEWATGGPLTAFDLGFLTREAPAVFPNASNQGITVLRSIAGLLFTLLVWTGFILVVPRRASPPLEAFKWIVTAVLIATLLPWVLIPLFFQENPMAVSDNITLFLSASGINGYLVMLFFAVLIIAVYRLANAKISAPGLVRDLILGQGEEMEFSRYRRFYIPVLAAAGIILAFNITVAGLNRGSPGQENVNPPAGYQFIREVQLSGRANQDLAVIAFNHNSTEPKGIFIKLRNVQDGQITLRLTGPDDFSRILLDVEGYSTAIDSVLFEEPLKTGQYQVLLTSQKSPGSLAFYTRGR